MISRGTITVRLISRDGAAGYEIKGYGASEQLLITLTESDDSE